jgi:transcriptional regulator with XRE-family HTH domain
MRGDRLKQIRLIRGHTQESLAELLGIGNRQIWRYENNETEPDGETVARLAQALDVSSDYLLGISDDEQPNLSSSDLKPQERVAITAWRRGDKFEAIKAIVNE